MVPDSCTEASEGELGLLECDLFLVQDGSMELVGL